MHMCMVYGVCVIFLHHSVYDKWKEIRRELELELVLDRNKDTRREKKRKTILYQKYVHAGDTKTKNIKMKKERNIQ